MRNRLVNPSMLLKRRMKVSRRKYMRIVRAAFLLRTYLSFLNPCISNIVAIFSPSFLV
jgi:hypothetical protein